MSAVTTMTASATATMLARLVALCSDFKLPTLANELIPRFQQAGHEDVLPLVLEVFELEAQDRLERRIDRLRRASHLPPGKTMATLDQAHLPRPLVDKLRTGNDPHNGQPRLFSVSGVGHRVSVVAEGTPFVHPVGVAIGRSGDSWASDQSAPGWARVVHIVGAVAPVDTAPRFGASAADHAPPSPGDATIAGRESGRAA